MKAVLTALTLSLLLAACGQYGPLRLPEPPPEKEKPAEAPKITPVISPEAR